MKQLIYCSQPFGFDEAMLAGILSRARYNNIRDAITGALICRHDIYLQLIEGPAAAIANLYARISVDDRHCDVRLLLDEEVDQRMFPEWSMLDDTAPSMIWSQDDISGGVLGEATPEALRAVFEGIAQRARAAKLATDTA